MVGCQSCANLNPCFYLNLHVSLFLFFELCLGVQKELYKGHSWPRDRCVLSSSVSKRQHHAHHADDMHQLQIATRDTSPESSCSGVGITGGGLFCTANWYDDDDDEPSSTHGPYTTCKDARATAAHGSALSAAAAGVHGTNGGSGGAAAAASRWRQRCTRK